MLRALIASSVLCFVSVLNGFAYDTCCRDSCYDVADLDTLIVACTPFSADSNNNCPNCVVEVHYIQREDTCVGSNYRELYIRNMIFESCPPRCRHDPFYSYEDTLNFDNTEEKFKFALSCLLGRHMWYDDNGDTLMGVTVYVKSPSCITNESMDTGKRYLFCNQYNCCIHEYYLEYTIPDTLFGYKISHIRDNPTDSLPGLPNELCLGRECLESLPICNVNVCNFFKFTTNYFQINNRDDLPKNNIEPLIYPNPITRDKILTINTDISIDDIKISNNVGIGIDMRNRFKITRNSVITVDLEGLASGSYSILFYHKGKIVGGNRLVIID